MYNYLYIYVMYIGYFKYNILKFDCVYVMWIYMKNKVYMLIVNKFIFINKDILVNKL